MLGLTSSGSDTSAQPQDLDVFASVFLWVYYGGRFLLMVMTWWGKHLRLPLIGRFAEALAMRRYGIHDHLAHSVRVLPVCQTDPCG